MDQAIILAGGKGTRLLPYTIVIPKPMLPVGEIPIIEVIARQLNFYGFGEVTISLGYRSEIIQIFLESKKNQKDFPRFKFFKEDIALGTSGSVKAINPATENFLVINGDILTTLNMREMFNKHIAENACLTVGVRLTDYKLPLGSITVDDNSNIISFVEKPSVTHLDNIGAYVYSKKVLTYINENEKIDVNILVQRLINAGEKVIAFRSDGPYYWIDIGTHADYEKANTDFATIRKSMLFLESEI
jgi:NDP-sugar pyrophosphorylase family protein